MELRNEQREGMAKCIMSCMLNLANQQDDQNILETNFSTIPLYRQISNMCARAQKLRFILPAFPAKSSNPGKTSGVLPDLGEFIALVTLDQLCRKISDIYAPGAEIIICSDGRVFNDLVFVSNENLEAYKNKIEDIIKERQLTHLSTFDLEDYYKEQNLCTMKQLFCRDYAQDLELIKGQVKNEQELTQLFNGIHRFIKEDFAVHHSEKSNNQIHKQSKMVAYQVIQRSRAWDQLLNVTFPNTLRLSIHPYPLTHHKFGIKLVPSSDRWATPWHNVVVKDEGEFHLMKKVQALSLGHREKKWGGEYAYFTRD